MVSMVTESLEIMSQRAEETGSCGDAPVDFCIRAWSSEKGDSCCVEDDVLRRSLSSESEWQCAPLLPSSRMLEEDMESWLTDEYR